jgi:hypothetical protein
VCKGLHFFARKEIGRKKIREIDYRLVRKSVKKRRKLAKNVNYFCHLVFFFFFAYLFLEKNESWFRKKQKEEFSVQLSTTFIMSFGSSGTN